MNKSNQTGAAAIYFVFVVIAIMSMGVLSIEGGRYIAKKARMGDALEAASIAVSVQDRIKKKKFDHVTAQTVATNWLNHYVEDAQSISVIAKRELQDFSYDISQTDSKKRAYYRYDIEADTTLNSWFKSSSLPTFDKQVNVANTGTSGRIKGRSVDIVYVADFSETMEEDDDDDIQHRLFDDDDNQTLKAIVKKTSEALFNLNNKSTFGFIPFAKRIVIKRNDPYKYGKERFFCVSPLKSPQGSDFEFIRGGARKQQYDRFGDLMLTVYKDKTGQGKGQEDREQLYKQYGFTEKQKVIARKYIRWLTEFDDDDDNGVDDDDCDDDDDYDRKDKDWAKCSVMPFRQHNNLKVDYNTATIDNKVPFSEHIDIRRTAHEITVENLPFFYSPMPYDIELKDSGLFDDDEDEIAFERYCAEEEDDLPEFYNIERRRFDSKADLDKNFTHLIEEMEADGGTDVYQGLLAAPHMFYGSKNTSRFIITLGDGGENNTMFSELVQHGMCDNIRAVLSKNGQSKHNVKLINIKFPQPKHHYGSEAETAEAYRQCFDHTINFTDIEQTTKALLDLVAGGARDDIGHNFVRDPSQQ